MKPFLCVGFLVLSVLVVPCSFGQLVGTTVAGSVVFNTVSTPAGNGFDPAGGDVPSGYANSSGATITLGSSASTFGFMDIYNTDTAQFDGTLLTLTDDMYGGSGATGWTMAFADSSFASVTNVSDDYIDGGVTASCSGGVITLYWGGSYSPDFVLDGTYTAVFAIGASNGFSGHVYCVCDSNAITGATVEIGTNSTTCDANGAYTFTNVSAGTYTTTVTATNYQTLMTNLTVAPGVTNDFYLTNTTFVINAVMDSSIAALPGADLISNSIMSAIQVYSQKLTDPLCVQIVFYATNSGLAGSFTKQGAISYSQYLADLEANTNMSANDITALASLHPAPNTGLLSNTMVLLNSTTLEVIGEHSAAAAVRTLNGGPDGVIYLNIALMNVSRPGLNPSSYDLESSVNHEVDEILGIGGWGSQLYLPGVYSGQSVPTNGVGPLDLYRYVSPGFRSFSFSPNVAPYFSIDGGTNVLVHFNQYGSGSDFGDWGDGMTPADEHGNNPPQVQDAFGAPSAAPDMGANEFIALDIIGYTLSGITSIQGIAYNGDVFTFSAATLPGQTYQPQYSTSLLKSSWINLGSPIVATDITTTITDPTASSTARYYRLVTVRPVNGMPALVHSRPQPVDPKAMSFETPVDIRRYLPRSSQPAQE
jgi:hypothetical protein